MASYPKVDKQDHRAKDRGDYVGNFVLASHFVHTILTFVDKIAASCINCHIYIHDTLAFESSLDFVPELLLVAHDNVFVLCPGTLRMSVTPEVRMETDIFGCAGKISWVCAGLTLGARFLARCLAIMRVFIFSFPL